MHDIDRTQAEYFGNMEADEMQTSGYAGEFEDYDSETDEFETDELNEYGNEMEFEDNEVLSEADEMELASELLEVQDEAELEQFLGSFFRKIKPFAGNFLRSSAGRALVGI